MARTMRSRVWNGVAYNVLTEHLETATWDPSGLTVCNMYAYARSYGVTGCKHPGFDISMPHGTQIYAARSGKVVQMRNPGRSGYMSILIEDEHGERQEYVHFSRTDVSMGQMVKEGQRIGLSGTLNSPHLHFEHLVRNNSTTSGWSFKNPEAILVEEGTIQPTPSPTGTGLSAISGDFRKIGDINVSVYEHEYRRLNSPLLASATTIRNAASPMSALALAQMFMENKYSTVGHIIKVEDNNPLAMRPWESDPRRNGNKPVLDWSTRAVVGSMNLPAHYAGAIRSSDGLHMARFNSVADCMREYNYRLQANSPYKNGVYNKARTLREMLNIYAPAGDVHPITGVANENSGYYNTVVTKLNEFFKLQGTTVSTPGVPSPVTGSVPTGQHKFILAMGHRNTDRGGAAEMEWTPGATRAVRDAIKAHGGLAWIVQEEDGNGDPNWYPAGLQSMARKAVELDSKLGPFKAYISQHYNGAGGRGAFAIHPESHDSSDTKAANKISVEFARSFARHMKATNTVPLLGWMKDGPGVMSERETGVGAQGYRLGEFVGAMGFSKTNVVRTILEAGGGDTAADRVYLYDPHWVRHVYGEVVVKALKDIFGEFKVTTGTARFTPGQWVQFVGEHRMHRAPSDASETTGTMKVGQRAQIISGPMYDAQTRPWWDVRVENFGTGWVKETSSTGAPILDVDKTALVDVLTGVLEDIVQTPAPGPTETPADQGPEGWLFLPMDGTAIAKETVMGKDFTLGIREPVSWVEGPTIGSWAVKVEPGATNLMRNPYAETASFFTAAGPTAQVHYDFMTSVAASGIRTTRATAGQTMEIYQSSATASVTVGQTYTASVTVRPDRAAGTYFGISWRTSAGVHISGASAMIPSTTVTAGGDDGDTSLDGVEQRVSYTAVAPATASWAYVFIGSATGSVGETIRTSGWQLEVGRVATTLMPKMEPGTRNLLANPSAEMSLDRIGTFASGGVTQDRVHAVPDEDGEWVVHTESDGSVQYQGVVYQSRTGMGWTGRSVTLIGQMVASIPDGQTIVPDLFHLRVVYTDGTTASSTNVNPAVTSGPTRFVTNTLATNAAKTVNYVELFLMKSTTGAAWALRTDAAMVEVGTVASPFERGSDEGTGILMPGYAWTGTAHASTSTRAAGQVKADRGELNFNGNRGTVYVRVRTADLPADAVERRVFGIGTPSTTSRNAMQLGIAKAANGSITAIVTATNATTTRNVTSAALASPPTWVLVTVDWENAGRVRVRLENGVWAQSTTNWQTVGLWGAPLYVGSSLTGETHQYGDGIDQLIHFDRKLTTEQDTVVRTSNYWSPNMLLSGVTEVEPTPVEPNEWEDISYTPGVPPSNRLAAEPFIREGRQYSVQVQMYKGTIMGQIMEPLTLNYEGDLRITHSDDAAIKRTMTLSINDIMDLRLGRGVETYANSLIPVMVVTDDRGNSRYEQLGVFLLTPYGGSDDITHSTTEIQANDLTWLLARTPILTGWTAPGNTEIGSIIRSRLIQLGVPPGQIAIGDTGKRTPPEGVPFFPGTTWLQSFNHLFNMARWYVLSATRRGVYTSGPWSSITGVAPVMHYDTRRGHFIEGVVNHDPDWGRFGNIAVARKLPTTRGDTSFYWAAVNDNATSPSSTKRRGPILIEPIIDGDFESDAECKAAAEAQLARGASYFNRISITTGVEMTAESNQTIAVDVERAGHPLVTGHWWRQSWETVFNGVSAYTVHNLNRVEVFS